MTTTTSRGPRRGHTLGSGLILAALGVVYGDIGTSPMYALQDAFFGHTKNLPDPADVMGTMSMVVWMLIIVISVKYLFLVLRADNDGEGGVFALYSRLHSFKDGMPAFIKTLILLAAGFLLGEGMITPAISVLSAVEGVRVIAPTFADWVLPIAVMVLTVLFGLQRFGSSKVGRVFGPIAVVWFAVIAGLGLKAIIETPVVLMAFNPVYALKAVFSSHPELMLERLGALVLVITGGEALFADMGHFGVPAIRRGWFFIVLPALLLNYLGQGAYLLSHNAYTPEISLFFSLTPEGWLGPFILLSTIAAVIASQALISGAFSLASQAVALGLFPRIGIKHTHQDHSGQTFLPVVNALLFVGSVTLVLHFKSSVALASAYGFALSVVMLVTSCALLVIVRRFWGWSVWFSAVVFVPLIAMDLMFVVAKSVYFMDGGYVSAVVGVGIFTVISAWRWGRKATAAAYSSQSTLTLKRLIELKEESDPFIRRNVIFMVQNSMSDASDQAPPLIQMYLNRYHLLPEHMLLVQVVHQKTPYIHGPRHESKVFYRSKEKGSIIGVSLFFGFMEEPNVEKVLESLAAHHELELPVNPHKWLIHVSHEYLIPPAGLGLLERLKMRLFLFLRQITQPAYYYYGLGRDVNLSMDIMPVRVPPEATWGKLLKRR